MLMNTESFLSKWFQNLSPSWYTAGCYLYLSGQLQTIPWFGPDKSRQLVTLAELTLAFCP